MLLDGVIEEARLASIQWFPDTSHSQLQGETSRDYRTIDISGDESEDPFDYTPIVFHPTPTTADEVLD